jgi:hypothetical protein
MGIGGIERLNVFIKVFISFLVPLGLTNIFYVLIKRFTNLKLSQNSDFYFYCFIIVISFIFTLAMFESYLFSSKSIKIDDRLLVKKNIKTVMKKMKWKTVDEDENIFTFKYPFYKEFRSFKITIRFIDTEAIISGPEQYVDKVIGEYTTLIAN